MTAGSRTRSAAPGLRRVWNDRPRLYSRPLWLLVIALDFLPWPWGEDLLARLFWIVGLLRASRRRPAVAWAAARGARPSRRLALAVCAFRGRWVARSMLVGVRHPADLGARVVVRGEELLAASAPRGRILLGFHLGPPNADVALRIRGHSLAFLGTVRRSRAWARPEWSPLLDPRDHLSPPDADTRLFWVGYLYRARRMLLEGRTIFIMADSWVGRERALFVISVPGGAMTVRSGWLALSRQTGAEVVPVTTHLEGRAQIITICSPLPQPGADADEHVRAVRGILSRRVEDYVERFPEQCPALVFPPETIPGPERQAPGAAAVV